MIKTPSKRVRDGFVSATKAESPRSERIALFTANLGGIDGLKPIPRHPQIDTFFITNSAEAMDSPDVSTWTRVIRAAAADTRLGDRLHSKYYKTQVHRLKEAQSYRWLAWADASLQFHDLDFVAAAAARLEDLPVHHRLLLVPHPKRRTVREEYAHVRRGIEDGNQYLAVRYSLSALADQMEFLAAERLNVDGRLWAMGFWLVENNDRVNACWDEWWDHLRRFGMMDQLPLPPLVEKFGLVPDELTVDIRDNRHFRVIAHRKLV